ncbi:MAG: arginine repressor, partial [Thermoanaerobaculia bacterium]
AKSAAGYVVPGAEASAADGELKARREERLERALREWVLGVATAGNLVVLKTPPAAAHPVARALDEAALEGVVGTIAGDDTIFLAAATGAISQRLARRLASGLLSGRSRRGRG